MTAVQRWSLTAAILASSVVFLDSTVVTIALPRIGEGLSADRFGLLEAQSYVYNGYLLALAALLVPAGAVSDRYGRRRVFSAGIAGFAAASVMCGLAWSMESLIAFRILQGVAGAFVVPGSLALITAVFDEEHQGHAFGVWAGASAVATIFGPFLGGALVDVSSWRAAFFVTVPLLALALWAVRVRVPDSPPRRRAGRFDWPSAALTAIAVGGLSFGAIRGQESRWQDPVAVIGLAAGAVALAALPVRLRRAPHPLVPGSLLRSPDFVVVNVATLLIYGALYLAVYFVPLYLQGVLGYNAAAAGIALAAAMSVVTVASARFGELATRHGPRRFMTAGAAVMGLGLLWFVRMPADSAAWVAELDAAATLVPPRDFLVDVLPALVVFGMGTVAMVAPLTTALMASVPEHDAAVASAVNNAVSRVGPQLATAVVFIVVNSIFYAGLGDRAPELDTSAPQVRAAFSPLNAPAADASASQREAAARASTDAFGAAMAVAAGMLLTAAGVTATGLRGPGAGTPVTRRRVQAAAIGCAPLDVDCVAEEPGAARPPPLPR